MNKTFGLYFKKFDLHIHTPASDCHKEKQITAKAIVEQALAEGLKGIAITDHQTGDFIDSIKNEAEGTGLIVFPGVELSVTGGKYGIHIICLFDFDKNSSHVNQFLNTLKIYDKHGKKTLLADCTVGQIADTLMTYDSSAIMMLAHSHSEKGVLGDMRGEQRKNIFDPRRLCLLGAEASESDFLDADKIAKKRRVFDVLNGDDPNYCNRKLGVYQSSDAHTLNDIGSVFTYFKVDDPVSINDIRQALIDRDTRIRQSYEYQENVYPRIKSLKISGGFLDDQEFTFHEGLNSILGAKGSGKSLAVEFLRFAISQAPSHPDLLNDHHAKLTDCLKTHGSIEVVITDGTGKTYFIKRTFNPHDGNPIEIIDMSDNSKMSFPIEQVFPLLFLSQNEIAKIAKDTSGRYQRTFIDQFFDFRKYQAKIESLNNSLRSIDRLLAESFRSYIQANIVSKQIKALQQEIAKIDRQSTNPLLNEFSTKEKIGIAINRHIEFLNDKLNYFKDVLEYYNNLIPPKEDDKEIIDNPYIKRSVDISLGTIKDIKGQLAIIIKKIGESIRNLTIEYQDWFKGFSQIKKSYEEFIKQAGGNQVALNEKRKSYQNQLISLDKELTKHNALAGKLKNHVERRKLILDELEQTRKEYYKERKARCEFFTRQSTGILNVTISESSDTSEFNVNLMKLKRGSFLRDEEIEKITNSINPNEFVKALLNYEYINRADLSFLDDLSTQSGIPLDSLKRLFDHLLDENSLEDLLSLIYSSIPDDVPSINYKVGDQYKPLNELSVGQKAIALLLIALSESNTPIIIDQPEDSLDLRSIWHDVCMNLRETKERRQFIFTTHNSSVAVASDTDKFTILEADAIHGTVLYTGSLNSPTIRQEVIDYLEGGTDTYQHKRRKYNIN